MNRLLTIEEKLQIIDEIETIFVTGKGMPQSANDDIMVKLRALKVNVTVGLWQETLKLP